MEELNIYKVTCHTDGCRHQDVTIDCLGPEGMTFLCGPCSQIIDDWYISDDSQ